MVEGWKQTKCPSMDEWIQKMWYTHTTEHYSALKMKEIKEMKEILIHATTWMNLEDTMLSKMSQSQKDRHCTVPLT